MMRTVAALLLCAPLAEGTASAEQVAGPCPGLPAGWLVPADGTPEHRPILDVRTRTPETVWWAGREISRERLRQYLRIAGTMSPTPFVILDPGPQPDCDLVDLVRTDLQQSGICRAGGCGEGHGQWADHPPGPQPTR